MAAMRQSVRVDELTLSAADIGERQKDLRDGAQLNSPQESARFGEEAKRVWAE